MDIWFTWCRRRAACDYCDEVIEVATPMVTGKIWRKGNPNTRKWNIRLYWHPKCYMAQGMQYLKDNPYVAPGNRGRPKLQLSEEDTRRRRLILCKKAAVDQRTKELKAQFPDNLLIEARARKRVEELAKELEGIGGVPKSWEVLTKTVM